MSSIAIIKRKATGFFKPNDLLVVRECIHDCHLIVSNASILVKAYYCKLTESSNSNTIVINNHLFSLACNIIQGAEQIASRSTCKDNNNKQQKETTFDDLLTIKKDIFGDRHYSSKCSLSHILKYSITNLITAYENNIQSRFLKYARKVIKCRLMKNHDCDHKKARKLATMISGDMFYKPRKEWSTFVTDEYNFDDCFPQNTSDKPHCYQIKKHPWEYLKWMVLLNRQLDNNDFKHIPEQHRKLYSPLPFHSSFVPNHIRLDTSGLCQLLMNKKKIEEFKQQYFVTHGYSLQMNSKADMLSKYSKLHGIEPKDKLTEGLFATELWDFNANLKTSKQWKSINSIPNMMFDNAIITDGISISFQVIRKSKFGRKEFKIKKAKEKKDDLTIMNQEKVHHNPSNKLIGVDPGKRDILSLTDGVKFLRYTRGQRQSDTKEKERRYETLKMRQNNGIEKIESEVLSETRKKDCNYDGFKAYAVARMAHEEKLLGFYSHPMFRQMKFFVYCKSKSSEDKFKNKINATYLGNNIESSKGENTSCLTDGMRMNASKKDCKLTMGWGNWGKNPNMKNNQPTPGIGIRRRFESHYNVQEVNEYLTSKTCPCCRKERSFENVIPKGKHYGLHHLLRCKNDECQSSFWNRNVVGSMNILRRFIENISSRGVDEANCHFKKAAYSRPYLECPKPSLKPL